MDNKTFFPRRAVWLTCVLLALAIVGALWFLSPRRNTEARYVTAPVVRGDIENAVVSAGNLQPYKYVDVGAQTSGQLKSLKVKRGDQVEKGQLLAEIDPVLASAAVTAAQATLENLTALREAKRAQLELASLQLNRSENLLKSDALAASDAQTVRAAHKVASAEVDSLSAQIKQTQAAVDTARANLGYTKITAPMTGEVVAVIALEGQTLNANQQAPIILRLADLNTMTVWTQVSEADVVRVKVGQDAYFTVLGEPERRHYGKVRQILPSPELINNVVFYNVLFDIPNPQHDLKIQMTAQVFIILAQAKDVMLIPTAALGKVSADGRGEVRVHKADGSVEPRPVKIGIKSGVAVQVIDDLKEGEQVVIGEAWVRNATQGAPGLKRAP